MHGQNHFKFTVSSYLTFITLLTGFDLQSSSSVDSSMSKHNSFTHTCNSYAIFVRLHFVVIFCNVTSFSPVIGDHILSRNVTLTLKMEAIHSS